MRYVNCEGDRSAYRFTIGGGENMAKEDLRVIKTLKALIWHFWTV